jgi:hypothetical protein
MGYWIWTFRPLGSPGKDAQVNLSHEIMDTSKDIIKLRQIRQMGIPDKIRLLLLTSTVRHLVTEHTTSKVDEEKS